MLKTRRNLNSINKATTVPTESEETVYVANHLGRYKYPCYDDVPPDSYVSEIVLAQEKETKSGKKAVEIFCKLEPCSQVYKRTHSLLKEGQPLRYYYIRQCYTYGSPFFEEFKDAMSNAIGKVRFKLSEIIGVTEEIDLGYRYSDNFGSIVKRTPLFPEAQYAEEDDEDDTSTFEDCKKDVRIDENRHKLLDEDDDDDFDFLEEE